MPKYRFCVKAPNGKIRRGTVNEVDLEAARLRLLKAGFEVLELRKDTELIIESPTAMPGQTGRGAPRFQRAAILEFDETPWERLTDLARTYLLRREAAVAILLVGILVIVGRIVLAPESQGPQKPDYRLYEVNVDVELAQFDGRTLRVSLPEIPFTHSEPTEVAPVGAQQTVIFEIEAVIEPRTVSVRLFDATGNSLAAGESSLTQGEGDSLRTRVYLEAVQPEPSGT